MLLVKRGKEVRVVGVHDKNAHLRHDSAFRLDRFLKNCPQAFSAASQRKVLDDILPAPLAQASGQSRIFCKADHIGSHRVDVAFVNEESCFAMLNCIRDSSMSCTDNWEAGSTGFKHSNGRALRIAVAGS